MSDEMDMDLMDALFGVGSMETANYLKSNEELRNEQAPLANEEKRAAEFEQMVADADVTAIENDTTVMGWHGRLHRGQFASAARQHFDGTAVDLAYEAYFCDVRMARADDGMWRALKQLQTTEPVLSQIVIGSIAWRRNGVEDHGSFGNDGGE